MKAFSLPLSENVFISFLKDIFMGCRILSWQFFSFLSACLLSEICSEIFILLLVTCHFSLLSKFLYFLWFLHFDYDGFIWICPDAPWASCICKFMSFTEFGKFIVIISSKTFFHTNIFFFSLRALSTCTLHLFILFRRSWGSVNFSAYFLSVLFVLFFNF